MQVDLVGLGWMGASLTGVAIAGIGVYEGILDIRALGTIQNGRRRIARGFVRAQLFRVIACGLWALVGAPLAFDDKLVPLNGFTAALLTANILLATSAALDLRDRRRLQRGE